jgi:hypothetical protein
MSIGGLKRLGERQTSEAFASILHFHNFATLENQLTYQCPSSWPVVITMKKKLAST